MKVDRDNGDFVGLTWCERFERVGVGELGWDCIEIRPSVHKGALVRADLVIEHGTSSSFLS